MLRENREYGGSLDRGVRDVPSMYAATRSSNIGLARAGKAN